MDTQRVSDTGVLTTVHLALIAVLAVITVLGILWGMRLKRQRDHARAVEEERMEELGVKPAHDEPGQALEEPSARTDTAVADKRAANDPAAVAPAVEEPRDRTSETKQADERAARDEAPAPLHTPPAPPPVAPAPPAADDGPVVATPPLADEPVAAAAPLDASPASEAQPALATPAEDYASAPVTTLKGLGPKVAAKLAEHDITTVGDVAALDDAAAERLDVQLGAFTGRMRRDRWLEQAQLLAAGDRAGFEQEFGKL